MQSNDIGEVLILGRQAETIRGLVESGEKQ